MPAKRVRLQKVTVGPPPMCDPPCYHAARSRLLEKYIKKLRLELLKVSALKAKLAKQKAKIDAAKTAEADKDREEKPRDLEVDDLVTQFQRQGGE